jgi:hypothetical protein
MDKIRDILIRTNPRYVAYIPENFNKGAPVNQEDVIHGVAELNKRGIIVWDISVGVSYDGTTKLTNIDSFGLYKNEVFLKVPVQGDDVIDTIPFKTDSWVLGMFLAKLKTGKNVPRRFLKSQTLLDKFTEGDEILQKLLVLDSEKRINTWDLIVNQQKDVDGGCTVQ